MRGIHRGGLDNPVGTLITVVFIMVVLLVGGQIIHAAGMVESEEPTYLDKAEAYGNLTYGEGNFEIFNARTWGNHGGWHLEGDDGRMVHLHDIRTQVLTDAYYAEKHGVEPGEWHPENIYKPWYERGNVPDIIDAVLLAIVLVVIILALKYLADTPLPRHE